MNSAYSFNVEAAGDNVRRGMRSTGLMIVSIVMTKSAEERCSGSCNNLRNGANVTLLPRPGANGREALSGAKKGGRLDSKRTLATTTNRGVIQLIRPHRRASKARDQLRIHLSVHSLLKTIIVDNGTDSVARITRGCVERMRTQMASFASTSRSAPR
jgi:hypothetical protein